MNADSTNESRALVTPKLAIARRSQMISYRRLQNPEIAKNKKNQRRLRLLSRKGVIAIAKDSK
jgi:hypothetical protein